MIGDVHIHEVKPWMLYAAVLLLAVALAGMFGLGYMTRDLKTEPCAVNFYQIKVDHVSAEVGRADGMSINNPDAVITVRP